MKLRREKRGQQCTLSGARQGSRLIIDWSAQAGGSSARRGRGIASEQKWQSKVGRDHASRNARNKCAERKGLRGSSHWLSRATPTSTRKVSAAVRYGALKLTAWWLCEDGMISDEGHGGQVASVRRAVTHARERDRERARARAREQKAEGVGSNAQRERVHSRQPKASLAHKGSRAAEQQSNSLRRRCGLDIP